MKAVSSASPVVSARLAAAGVFLFPLACVISAQVADVAAVRSDKKAEEVVELDKLTIEESQISQYAPTSASQIGPLGKVELIDTPFSINVISRELIENLQAVAPDDLYRVNPVTQLSTPQTRFFTAVTMRGFSSASTKRIDGIPSTSTFMNVDLEDKERVEVITGLSGFLNGAGNVGGSLNYVLKRPTPQRFNQITAGLNGGTNAYIHGDFGGPIDAAGKFGYRINVVGQDGDTDVDYQSIERRFVSAAFDWNLTPSLRLQVDGSFTDYRMEGTEPFWATSAGIRYPAAPDADNFYGQPFTSTDTKQHHLGARVQWQVSKEISVRAGVVARESEIDLVVVNNTFIPGPVGTYGVQASAWEYPEVETWGGFAFADAQFETGALKHTLTTGWYGDSDERTNFVSSAGGWATLTYASGFNLAAPVYVANPGLVPVGPKYKAQESTYDNFVIGDSIRWGEHWLALVGVNYAKIGDTAFGANGAITSDYDDDAFTPTYALIFKPVPVLSTYVSYMESFEKGGAAAATFGGYPVTNAFAIMPPLTSEQVEAGAKYQLGKAFLTGAAFEIDKGLQYYDVSTVTRPIYVQDGRQVHRGFEFTASGEVVSGLSVVGGFTWLRAEIKENKQTPALVGKQPVNVAERSAKLYLEYALPYVKGLTLTGGVFYTGEQFVDTANTDELPSFTTGDLGVRYQTTVFGRATTFRAAVTNVTNENYWLNSTYVGTARALRVSAAINF